MRRAGIIKAAALRHQRQSISHAGNEEHLLFLLFFPISGSWFETGKRKQCNACGNNAMWMVGVCLSMHVHECGCTYTVCTSRHIGEPVFLSHSPCLVLLGDAWERFTIVPPYLCCQLGCPFTADL